MRLTWKNWYKAEKGSRDQHTKARREILSTETRSRPESTVDRHLSGSYRFIYGIAWHHLRLTQVWSQTTELGVSLEHHWAAQITYHLTYPSKSINQRIYRNLDGCCILGMRNNSENCGPSGWTGMRVHRSKGRNENAGSDQCWNRSLMCWWRRKPVTKILERCECSWWWNSWPRRIWWKESVP